MHLSPFVYMSAVHPESKRTQQKGGRATGCVELVQVLCSRFRKDPCYSHASCRDLNEGYTTTTKDFEAKSNSRHSFAPRGDNRNPSTPSATTFSLKRGLNSKSTEPKSETAGNGCRGGSKSFGGQEDSPSGD